MKIQSIIFYITVGILMASSLIFSSCSSNDAIEDVQMGKVKINPQVSLDVIAQESNVKATTIYNVETNNFGVYITQDGSGYNNSEYNLGNFPTEGILMPLGIGYNIKIDSGYIGVINEEGNSDYRGASWDTPFYQGVYNGFEVQQNEITTLSFAVLQSTVLIDVNFVTTGDAGIPAGYDVVEAEVKASWADKHLKYTPSETRTGHFITNLKSTTPPATTVADYGTDTYTVSIKLEDTTGTLPAINKTFSTAELTANHKYTFDIKMDLTKTKIDVNVVDVAAQVESPITIYV